MDVKLLVLQMVGQVSWTWADVTERRGKGCWRLGAESNRCTRLCRPLHHHSAT